MAIPIDNFFQPESFAQANPFLTGFSAGQGVIRNGLMNQNQQYINQMNAVKAQYASPEAQQQLLKDQLNNQILQPQAQYAPQMTLAELALKQAMPNYYNSMGAEAVSKIPLNQAQANLANAQVPYLPYQMMGKYYQGIGQYMAHGPSSLAVRMQNNPAFNNFVANNPKAQANYAGLMDSALNNQVSLPGLPGMPPNRLNAGQQGFPQNNQTQNVMKNTFYPGQMQNQYTTGAAQQPQRVQTAYGSVNPSDINSIRNAVQNSYINNAFTQAQQQQIVYENSAENMLGKIAPDLPDITKYAGLAGHAGLSADKYASAFGLKTDPSYSKFINFSETQAPVIANELRRALGGQATDSEREVMDNLANPVYWNKSPQIAMNQMQTLFNTLRSNAKAITQPKNANLSQAINSINSPLKVPTISQSLNKNTNRIRVKSPDGVIGTISKQNLNDFLQNGYEEVQ